MGLLMFSFSHKGPHGDYSVPSNKNTATRLQRFCPRKPIRDSVPKVFVGCGHIGMDPNCRIPEGKPLFSINHSLYKQSRNVSQSYPLGNCV